MLDPCDERACFSVKIIDDLRVEGVESFSISLMYNGSNIIFNQDKLEIWINDTDGIWKCLLHIIHHFWLISLMFCLLYLYSVAIVSFQKRVYNISESASQLTVCVDVTAPGIHCPIQIPFSLTLTLTEDSAGKTSHRHFIDIIYT